MPIATRLSRSDPGLVAILAYDGLCTFEFGIATEMFALPRPEFSFPWYRHCVVAVDSGAMFALGGLQVHADATLAALADAKTIVIPGWRDLNETPPFALLSALQGAYHNGARILSICSGAFVLVASGLLDGKRATTHWRYCEALAVRYPSINVDAKVLYVDEGQIVSSAGSTAGIDACLHLVTRDFGAAVANQVARRMVMSPQRRGGQAQFIPTPIVHNSRQDFAQLQEWLRNRLDQAVSVSEMAQFMAMSERNFSRLFQQTMGSSPKAWMQHQRINRARELLETSNTTMDVIAVQCGFASTESFRSAFRSQTHLSPSAYRAQFSHPTDA